MFSFFIAYSTLVLGFRQANSTDISNVLYAQRDLLRRVLFLKDVHSKNYGVDHDGMLTIVDFHVLIRNYSNSG